MNTAGWDSTNTTTRGKRKRKKEFLFSQLFFLFSRVGSVLLILEFFFHAILRIFIAPCTHSLLWDIVIFIIFLLLFSLCTNTRQVPSHSHPKNSTTYLSFEISLFKKDWKRKAYVSSLKQGIFLLGPDNLTGLQKLDKNLLNEVFAKIRCVD